MKSLTLLTRNLRASLTLFCVGALLSFLMVFSNAQTDERVLNNTIPKHLPIKVKLKEEKEKSFKDMKNEKWVREFELEVKNTGDRPIYFLHLMLVLPETIVGGNPLMFPFYYGRNELSSFKNLAEKNDVPIYPGETYTFTIHPGQVGAWEKSVKEKRRPQPGKVDLFFEILSFGDHTGYVGHDGEAFVPRGQRPDLTKCIDTSTENVLKDVGWALTFPLKSTATSSAFYLPTAFSSVNFLSTSFTASSNSVAAVDVCCPGPGCEYIEFVTANICLNCSAQNTLSNVSCVVMPCTLV